MNSAERFERRRKVTFKGYVGGRNYLTTCITNRHLTLRIFLAKEDKEKKDEI